MTTAASSDFMPYWVEPPPTDQGSIDPLGYLAYSDQLAEALLPGMTVLTVRARYLSFLCWAIRETGNDRDAIDRWEIALSIGEFGRHSGAGCGSGPYLGSRLLAQRQLGGWDRLPRRLHVQTARMLYSGLLRSCDLVDDQGSLTASGEHLADAVARETPQSLPKRVNGCEGMPCLSQMGERERKWLRNALLDDSNEAHVRDNARREVAQRGWSRVRHEGVALLLAQYIAPTNARSTQPARYLHEAAKLELQSLPLTRLFLYLYQNEGRIRAKAAKQVGWRAYRVRAAPHELLADVRSHLTKLAALGDSSLPMSPHQLHQHLLARHREVKADAPWVDDQWRVLRPGLQPQKPPGVHEYRLRAFASLLRDLR